MGGIRELFYLYIFGGNIYGIDVLENSLLVF